MTRAIEKFQTIYTILVTFIVLYMCTLSYKFRHQKFTLLAFQIEDTPIHSISHPRINRIGNVASNIVRHSATKDAKVETVSAIKPIRFNSSRDILIYVHIQRTGGTQLDKILTHRIQITPPCKCYSLKKRQNDWVDRNESDKLQCQCSRPRVDSNDISIIKKSFIPPNGKFLKSLPPDGTWLFTRATHNWKYCGLHATYPHLRTCIPLVIRMEELLNQSIMDVGHKPFNILRLCKNNYSKALYYQNICQYINKTGIIINGIRIVGIRDRTNKFGARDFDRKRNYFFITNLRDPINRYMSEYEYVKAGARWNKSFYPCNGKLNRMPLCFKGTDNVTLEKFMSCPFNYANNRMTRHLADVENIGCYDNALNLSISKYNNLMLKSAKYNLQNSFQSFGLIEFPLESEAMHSNMFHLNITPDIYHIKTRSLKEYKHNLSSENLKKIMELNDLDIKLYKFGKKLFFDRYKEMVQQ